MILPFMEGMKFWEYAEQNGLYACCLTKVKTKVEKQEKRLMMEFALQPEVLREEELVIQEEDMSYTRQYIDLTSEFYQGLPKARN